MSRHATPVADASAAAEHDAPSLLMRSAGARLAAVLGAIALLWLAVAWALSEGAV